MSFLDTFRQKIASKDKDENSFLKSLDKKQDKSSGIFSTESFRFKPSPVTSDVISTFRSTAKSFVDEATSDKIINTEFFKKGRAAGDEVAALIRKPLASTFGAVESLSKEVIDAPEKISRIPAVQKSLKVLGERTSGTGVYSTIKSIDPDKTFGEVYAAARAYQANDPSKLNQFLYQLGDTLPQTGLGVALAFIPVAGGPLATTYFTGLSANEQIEKKGYVYSPQNILVDVALDRVLGASITSLMKAPGKSLAKTLATSFVSEGGTEVTQDLLKYNNDYAQATTEEERRQIVDEVKDYFKSGQILMTMGVGGISGAGAGGGAFITNQAVQQYPQMTPGQRQAGFVRIPGMDGKQGVDVTGLNLNNPIAPVTEIIDTHTRQSEVVLNDPDMVEILKQPGAMKSELESSRKNLADGLDAIGNKELATKIRGIEITEKTTPQSLNEQAKALASETSIVESDGFTFQQPLRSQAEDKEIAESVVSAREELNLMKEEYSQMEKAGAPADTLARLRDRMAGLESTFVGTQKEDQTIVTRNQAGQVDRIVDPAQKDLLYDSKGPSNLQPPGQYPATPGRLSAYNAFRQKAASLWDSILEKVQNDWIKVEGWVKQKGEIDADKNPVIARILYPGRLKTRVTNAIDEARAIDLDVVKTAEKLDITDEDLNKDLNDYLIAKHAPERNAKLGDNAAGITTEQANENLKKISELPYAKDIERLANRIYDLNKQTLEILYAEGNPWGLISSETKSLLESTYKNHVPLNRIFEETTDGDIVNVLNSKGLDVRGSGLKRAKGSERSVSDILTNVTSNLVQAITRAEKNYINYQIYEMVKSNPDTVAFVRGGEAIGRGFDERIIFAPENGENILPVMVDGKQKYIEFTDTDFAKTIRTVDTEKMPAFLKFVGAYGRMISQLVTRYSPEFLLTNKFRDVQEALVFAAAQPKLSGIKSLSKQAKKQLKIEGEKAIYDYLNKKDTEGTRLYKQMVSDGGATGGLGMNTRKEVELNIEKIKKLNRSKGRQALERVLNNRRRR